MTAISKNIQKRHGFFAQFFQSIEAELEKISIDEIEIAAKHLLQTHKDGKKVIVVGNGGSAAMASHLSIDFTKASGIRAISFNESSLLTCFSNDYGYENWVTEALKAYGDSGDMVILISSSGKSQNILNGASQAKKMEMKLITLSGFSSDNPLRKCGDINFWVDSNIYNIVEMVHHIWLVSIVDYIMETK